MENKKVFKIYIEHEGERKNIFGKVVKDKDITLFGYRYCFESDIKQIGPSEYASDYFYSDSLMSLQKYRVTHTTVKYHELTLSIEEMATRLPADDFISYCKLRGIDTITISV